MTRSQSVRVSAVVLLIGVVAGCAAPDQSSKSGAPRVSASHVFSGGNILTLREGPAPAALAIGGGRILGIGDLDAMAKLRGADTIEVDLAGRTLAPAFKDHHVHLLNLGLSLLRAEESVDAFVDLSGLSLEELAAELGRRAERLPAGSWILGKGWSQGAWGARKLPGHEVLTEAAPRHPVFLTRVDGHAGWINAEAMRIAGIRRSTPDPAGGAILRDAKGDPAGVLLERANELLRSHLPEPSDAEVRRAFRLATTALAEQGVIEVFDAGFLGPPGVVDLDLDLERYLDLLVAADRESPLPLAVHLMIPAPSALSARIAAEPERFGKLTARVDVSHFKFFADGALGSRGALLSHAYVDDPGTSGVERMTAAQIEVEAARALDAGLDVATHAIGDLAVERTLDVYQTLLRDRPDLDPGRLRVEHFSYARPEDFERAAVLGVVLSVNPDFVAPDDHGRTMEDARVGSDRSARVYAIGRMAEHGSNLAFGSDYFSAPFAPLYGFYAAVTRRNANGLPIDGWHPGERIARHEALRIQTTLWPPGGGGSSQGALEIGGPADLVILSADPLSVPESEILAISVERTYSSHVDPAARGAEETRP